MLSNNIFIMEKTDLTLIKYENAKTVANIMRERMNVFYESRKYFDIAHKCEKHTQQQALYRLIPPCKSIKTRQCIFACQGTCKYEDYRNCSFLHGTNENIYINPKTEVIWKRLNKHCEWVQYYG